MANIKFSPETVEQICDMLLDGKWINEACRKVNITDRTLRRWRADDDEIRAKIDDAQKMGYLKQLESAMSKLKRAKGRDQILRADKELVHLEWITSKMVPGFEDKKKVEATVKTMKVSWLDESDDDARALDPATVMADEDMVH